MCIKAYTSLHAELKFVKRHLLRNESLWDTENTKSWAAHVKEHRVMLHFETHNTYINFI